VLIEVNALFSKIVGFTQAELLGMHLERFTDPADIAAELHLLKELFDGKRRSYRIEKRYRTKANVTRWVELWVTALSNPKGCFDKAFGMVVDITDQKQASNAVLSLNSELKDSNQMLRDMAAQNDEIRESERTHIAHEVHDELGQVMTALRLKLSVIELRYGPAIPGLTGEVQEMKKLVDKAIHGVRNVVGSLRPSALDLGLVPAIEWLRTEFTSQTSVECVFDWDHRSFELDEKRSIMVFRIVQESLTNACRHANASRVDISLKYEGDWLQVVIRDNGIGFDRAVAGAKKTFGLLGMMERAIAMGGRLDVTSSCGEGTTIVLNIGKAADEKEAVQ
jgi:PAS domain S-box-containing protein